MRIKNFILAGLAAMAIVSAGSVLADTAKVMAENLARFQRYAGKPQDSVTVFQLQGWQPLGENHIAIWTGVNDVYLIRVAKPCINLSWTNGVGIRPHMNELRTRFDSIYVHGMPCQIESIRKVDYLAVRRSMGPHAEAVDPRPLGGSEAAKAQSSGGAL